MDFWEYILLSLTPFLEYHPVIFPLVVEFWKFLNEK